METVVFVKVECDRGRLDVLLRGNAAVEESSKALVELLRSFLESIVSASMESEVQIGEVVCEYCR
jgi:hypothetical protein